MVEVFRAFLLLGLTSFGGPIAHLGYFRQEFVLRRRWLDDAAYADLVALCQFLPGPASSQVGFALGWMRAGWAGALAAFVGFTLPSAVMLVVLAGVAGSMVGPVGGGVLHGLKVVAVAIVAQAVWGMARSLCPDLPRRLIALGALALMALSHGVAGMIAAMVAGALLGRLLPAGATAVKAARFRVAVPVWLGVSALGLFAALLAGLPLVAALHPLLALADACFRAGALVFGGGHVVLPLLETGLVQPGLVPRDAFLAGYGAAQAVPGPLFTVVAYLGAVQTGVSGAALALVAVFLPGFLLLVGVLPFWARLAQVAGAARMMQGANAAVVGILAFALFGPVMAGSVTGWGDAVLALACLAALMLAKAPPWAVVILAALGGIGLSVLG